MKKCPGIISIPGLRYLGYLDGREGEARRSLDSW